MHHHPIMREPQLKHPPEVTVAQWGLASFSLLLASLSYLASSHEELAVLTGRLTAVNVILLVIVSKEALQTQVLGKFLLVASTLVFFWVEALDLARRNLPFAVQAGLPIWTDQFSLDLVRQAYLYVVLFQLMLFVGYSVRPEMPRFLSWMSTRVDSVSNHARVFRYALAACALAPLLLSYGFDIGTAIQALLAAQSGARPEAEEIGLLHYLYFFGMYGAALFLAEALMRRGWRRIGNLLLGGIAALPFVMVGARHLWLFVALPACVVALIRLQGRVTLSRALRWGGLMLFVLVVIQFQYAIRGIGWKEIGNVTPNMLLKISTMEQFTALLFAEYLVPEFHDYFLEPAEPYFLIHWIPRQFWPEKPIMRSWDYYNEAYTLGYPFNVTPSVIGQFHINWGVFGVLFIGVWLGFLTFLADRALLALDIDRQRAMAVTLGMFYAFIVSSFRFYSPVYFTYFVFGMVGMLLLTRAQPALGRLTVGVTAMQQS